MGFYCCCLYVVPKSMHHFLCHIARYQVYRYMMILPKGISRFYQSIRIHTSMYIYVFFISYTSHTRYLQHMICHKTIFTLIWCMYYSMLVAVHSYRTHARVRGILILIVQYERGRVRTYCSKYCTIHTARYTYP